MSEEAVKTLENECRCRRREMNGLREDAKSSLKYIESSDDAGIGKIKGTEYGKECQHNS